MKCLECNGSGVAEQIGYYDRPCDACHGKGEIIKHVVKITKEETCPKCWGTGEVACEWQLTNE